MQNMQKKKISTYIEEEVLYLKSETYGNRHVKIVLVITIDRNVFTARSSWRAGNASYNFYKHTL